MRGPTTSKTITACLLAAGIVSTSAGGPGLGAQEVDPAPQGRVVPPPDVEGLTAEEVGEVERYLLDNGLPLEEIEGFAGLLEISVPELYRRTSAEIAETGGGAVDTPVEVVDGKLRYNNTVVDNVNALKSKSETQIGQRVTDGSCAFPGIQADTKLGKHVVSEVTELDPENCTRTVESAAYDPAKWNEPATATTSTPAAPGQVTAAIAGDSFIPGFSCKDGGIDTAPPTLFQPREWQQGEYRRYYKQAFVDPICISITSTSLNVSWKNQVNSASGVTLIDRANHNYYFTSLGENWTNKVTTLNPGTQPLNREGAIYATLQHNRTETDFPDHVVQAAAVFGAGIPGIGIIASTAAVWAACGFDLGSTNFASWQQFELRRNGGWGAVGWGTVNGGCSNLVHEQVWHGSGAYAR
jgi:hypothetical protein